jgi:hypothetical protein
MATARLGYSLSGTPTLATSRCAESTLSGSSPLVALDATFTVDVDLSSGLIDFYSKKKTAKKQFERVLSVRPVRGSFQMVQCLFESSDVSVERLERLWLETRPNLRSLNDMKGKENVDNLTENEGSRKRK